MSNNEKWFKYLLEGINIVRRADTNGRRRL